MSDSVIITLFIATAIFTVSSLLAWINAWALRKHVKRIEQLEYNYNHLWNQQNDLQSQHTRAYWEYKENLNRDLREEINELRK